MKNIEGDRDSEIEEIERQRDDRKIRYDRKYDRKIEGDTQKQMEIER